MALRISQTDPRANYLAHESEIDAAIAAVLDRGRYILGPEVESFEREFAAYLGAASVTGVASGTDALQLALRACGVGPGDSVVTVLHTAVATVCAVELAGAAPVLVDIHPVTFTMDCDSLETAIRAHRGEPLKAIIPVHLYGHPADMPALMAMAERYGLFVIEDCAQAHGAAIGGRRVGTWGHMAAFSFYPTKNLGALGDGGAVATSDPALGTRLQRLREYGWRERYISDEAGMNSRLDELQAAVLRVKLRYLDVENAKRRELASAYAGALAGAALELPGRHPDVLHAYHQYVVRSTRRDALQALLRERGVDTAIHYRVPVHLQPAYRGRLRHGSLIRTEEAAEQILSLPMYPELTLDDIASIGAAM